MKSPGVGNSQGQVLVPERPSGSNSSSTTTTNSSTTTQRSASSSGSGSDFGASVKKFFNNIISVVGVLFGVNTVDNANYVKLRETLPAVGESPENKKQEYLERAEFIRDKASEIMGLARKNVDAGKDPWEGISEAYNTGKGVSMSSTLGFLGGNDFEKEAYYHNVAAYWWSEAFIQVQRARDAGHDVSIETFIDLDNTRVSKAFHPTDTLIPQSSEKLFWGLNVLHFGNELNVHESINTARSIVATITQVVPEGLDFAVTHGNLNNPAEECWGPTKEAQLEASDICDAVVLNSGAHHRAGRATKLASNLRRMADFWTKMDGPKAPRDENGKTLVENIKSVINDKRFSALEPKGLTAYMFDCDEDGRFYYPHYLYIGYLKELHVDRVLNEKAEKGETVSQSEIDEAWENFRTALVERVDSPEAQARNDENIPDEDWRPTKEDIYMPQKYRGLLNTEGAGQALFDMLREARLTSPTFHYFNNHGSPVEDGLPEFLKILHKFSKMPETRQIVACQLMLEHEKGNLTGNGKIDVTRFFNASKSHFENGGPKNYLDFRILDYLNHFGNAEELTGVTLPDGSKVFEVDESDSRKGLLKFTNQYLERSSAECDSYGFNHYVNWINANLGDKNPRLADLEQVIPTFLPRSVLSKISNAREQSADAVYQNYLNGKVENYINLHKANDEDFTSLTYQFDDSEPPVKIFVKEDSGAIKFNTKFVQPLFLMAANDTSGDFTVNYHRKLRSILGSQGSSVLNTLVDNFDNFSPSAKLTVDMEKSPGFEVSSNDPGIVMEVDSNVDSPEQFDSELNNFLAQKRRAFLRGEDLSALYPANMYLPNNRLSINDKYCFDALMNFVMKTSDLDPFGQYYAECQSGEKDDALPRFSDKVEWNGTINVAGDSNSDKCMMARALLLGGSCNVIFNQVQDEDIYQEMLDQSDRIFDEFLLEDGTIDDNAFQYWLDRGVTPIKEVQGGYRKVVGWERVQKEDGQGLTVQPVFEETVYSKKDIFNEFAKKYRLKIIHDASPEAYIRRRAEIYGLITGRNIDFNDSEYQKAKEIYGRLKAGESFESLSSEEKLNFRLYEYSVIRELEGNNLPGAAPAFDVRYEWSGTDSNGDFIVYRSVEHDDALVVDRDGTIELYDGGEESLANLNRVEIYRCNDPKKKEFGQFIALDAQGNYVNVNHERVLDMKVESKLLSNPTSQSGLFKNKFLRRLLGEENILGLVNNLPNIFKNLLKYSGGLMAVGGLLRLVSPLAGGAQDSVYKAGWWASNGIRAVSAVGGALRGVLNVNRYWPIPVGEGINVAASFMPDGMKHLFLGLGNFVLFMGRGLQTAQRQQRINNHPTKLLDQKGSEGFKEKIKGFIDSREFARKVTQINTKMITRAKEAAAEGDLGGLWGEISGSLSGAAVSSIKMLKDIFLSGKDKGHRLLTQIGMRRAEKSGGDYLALPSPGHLMTLVGAVSGVTTVLGGVLGKWEKFGEKQEEFGGFNSVGRWLVSAACAIPALGIIFNGLEIKANTSGLPKLYNDLRGKDVKYSPEMAGWNQIIAGIGYGIVPWFNLSNKFVASIYDMVNGQYFVGASEEEGPNSYLVGLSQRRSSQTLYNQVRHFQSNEHNYATSA